MADSVAFERTCALLERETSFDRLEARGTVRLALKASGLDPRSVSPDQMAVVVGKLLTGELASRGVEDADRVCTALGAELAGLEPASATETPEAVFARLGRS
jgi:hypothetical protein